MHALQAGAARALLQGALLYLPADHRRALQVGGADDLHAATVLRHLQDLPPGARLRAGVRAVLRPAASAAAEQLEARPDAKRGRAAPQGFRKRFGFDSENFREIGGCYANPILDKAPSGEWGLVHLTDADL